MRLLVMSVAGVLSTSAVAADALREIPPPPVVDTAYDWSGLHAGLHIGGGFSNFDFVNTAGSVPFADLSVGETFSVDPGGFLGGVQLGYDWQSRGLVYGLEASFSAIDGQQSWNNTVFGGTDDRFKAGIDTLLLATARVGYAFDRTLVYVNGGYAGANFRASISDPTGAITGSGSDRDWISGFTVGAGVEYALTDRLSLGAQYNFVSFEDADVELGGVPGGYSFSANDLDTHVVSVRLNYHF